jgi:hypothetical protein
MVGRGPNQPKRSMADPCFTGLISHCAFELSVRAFLSIGVVDAREPVTP